MQKDRMDQEHREALGRVLFTRSAYTEGRSWEDLNWAEQSTWNRMADSYVHIIHAAGLDVVPAISVSSLPTQASHTARGSEAVRLQRVS